MSILILCSAYVGIAQTFNCRLHSRFVGSVKSINLYMQGEGSRRLVSSHPVNAEGVFSVTLPKVSAAYLAPASHYFGSAKASNGKARFSMLWIDGTTTSGKAHSDYMGPSYNGKRTSGMMLYVYATEPCKVEGNMQGMEILLSLQAGWNVVKTQMGKMTQSNGTQGWKWGTE